MTLLTRHVIIYRVIKSFSSRETENLFCRKKSAKIGSSIQKVALRKLYMLNAATSLEDLRVPPGNRLEKLKGSREGCHSIRINDQWRICFCWLEGNVYDVEIIDYH